ncbi:MAG: DUF4336 domain-containing protein [Methyloceanibacter sp.]
MADDARGAYPPLNILKTVAGNIWIVDGPIIRFGIPWPKMPFSTRMTVIRCAENNLFIHSPTALTPDLKAQVEALGRPRWIVGPNRIHYWWIPQWKRAFQHADVYLAPRIEEQAGQRIDFDCLPLDRGGGYPWDSEVATLPVRGRFMTEVVFFHGASRTLVLTDLVENFERQKLGPAMRVVARLGGVLGPDGQMPRDLRLTFPKSEIRAAAEKMIAWGPERVILAHGLWYDRNGTAALRRAFRWALN